MTQQTNHPRWRLSLIIGSWLLFSVMGEIGMVRGFPTVRSELVDNFRSDFPEPVGCASFSSPEPLFLLVTCSWRNSSKKHYGDDERNRKRSGWRPIRNCTITFNIKAGDSKISGFERDSNPVTLWYRCNALLAGLSKPHETSRVWVGPLCSMDVILGSSI